MWSTEEKTVLSCALDDDIEGLKSILESKSADETQQSENILWKKMRWEKMRCLLRVLLVGAASCASSYRTVLTSMNSQRAVIGEQITCRPNNKILITCSL